MAYIGWGKCRVFVKDIEDETASWLELPTPVEDTTKLETSKGDKVEAKIEGGENEDVKYNRSTYAITFDIRKAKKRNPYIPYLDGVVEHKYAIFVQPEDPAVAGPYMEKATVSIEDNFDTTDGGKLTYTFDSLTPDDSSAQVKWGTATITTADDGSVSAFTFAEESFS